MVAAVGLAVDVAAAGMEQATGLAGVIVGFCEIGVLVLGVAAWAAERRSSPLVSARAAATSAPEKGEEGSGADAARGSPVGNGKYVIITEKIDRSQIGDGNSQYNV